MDPIFEIELEDCPICRGVGAMQDEQGWCVSVNCLDCGAETAHASYHTPEERLEAAKRVDAAIALGITQAFIQEPGVAKESFIPDFSNAEGV